MVLTMGEPAKSASRKSGAQRSRENDAKLERETVMERAEKLLKKIGFHADNE